MSTAHGGAESAHTQAPVCDDGDRAGTPAAVGRGEQIHAGHHEHGDAVAGPHPLFSESCCDPHHSVVQRREGGRQTRGAVDEARCGVLGALGQSIPQRRTMRRRCLRCRRRGRRRTEVARRVSEARHHTLREPVVHDSSDVGLFHHEVADAGKPMAIGMRHSLRQVEREVVVEHRIARTPGQEHRHAQGADALGDASDSTRRGMCGVEGNIGDELGDGPTIPPTPIRGAVSVTRHARHAPPGERERAIDEHLRAPADEAGDGSGRREADECGRPTSRRHGNTGGAEHNAGHSIAVGHDPPERDGSAPVVGRSDDGTVHVQRLDHVTQVGDTFRKRPRLRKSIREAHAELIDCDDPVAVAKACHKTAPKERPCRVAVHADDGGKRMLGPAVEHVPGVCAAVMTGHVDQT